jgi:glycosyltransferase involved in cell wall biosynthesis
MTRPVRTLLFSTLYPSEARPLHGIFVETRLRELLRHGGAQARVVAPVPWYPSAHARHGRYAAMARTPSRECRHGIEVLHPRYLTLPKVGMTVAPFLLALGARAALARTQADGFDFDVIDAHYFYPDGVAAALLARWFGKPLVITARGTDVNLIPEHRLPRVLIQWAARQARASIGVSSALVERLRQLNVAESRLRVIRNGVDAERFQPQPAGRARSELGLEGAPVVLTVGNLHEHKGQRLVIEAFARVRQDHPQARLVVVGDGTDRAWLMRRATELGLSGHTTFAGTVPNAELARWYSAADVLVLASSREGWPNVLLEAMACGTPVVASAVGGVPEIVQSLDVGRLVHERSTDAFARAVLDVLDGSTDRARIRRYAQGFSWEHTSQAQLELFGSLMSPHGGAALNTHR